MAINRSAQIEGVTLRGLHPESIDDPIRIRTLLNHARLARSEVSRGLNHRLDIETAQIESVGIDRLVLRTKGFRRSSRNQVFLNFELGERPYFFSTQAAASFDSDRLTVFLPTTIYRSERRDRRRLKASRQDERITIRPNSQIEIPARLIDRSKAGLGLAVKAEDWNNRWKTLQVRYASDFGDGDSTLASVRTTRMSKDSGWVHLGVVKTPDPAPALIEVAENAKITEGLPKFAPERDRNLPETRVVEFESETHRPIVGLVDASSHAPDPVAVIIQTGWGDTKEGLLPLARTIVETFAEGGENVVVLRFDGINQKGESYRHPESALVGREYNHFGFSQPVSDLDAAANFLIENFAPKKTIVVSPSISALSGRKFVALDAGKRIDGWISLVGAPDLQSASRSISGGIDFAVGHEHGLTFGYQELLGVMIHADRMMKDAIEIGVLHLEDARTDFSKIDIPVSWIHGKFDAWVSLKRVQDIMSHGPQKQRSLVMLPITHRLGWSRTAFDTFAFVAAEVSKMALGFTLAPTTPASKSLSRRRAWERSRRPAPESDLQSFWQDYLLGRDESVGIELMTSCDPYGQLMDAQLDRLSLTAGDRILDLGCGTGSVTQSLEVSSTIDVRALHVVGVDLVAKALLRARERCNSPAASTEMKSTWVNANLDVTEGGLSIPFADASFDAVIASLFLSYVERPEVLLAEALRLLKPGGRLVISTLIKDADISRLYVESLAELQISSPQEELPELLLAPVDKIARNFLNDAAKILDLEAAGAFTFWDSEELVELVSQAGFVSPLSTTAFGTPAQAVVVNALKP